MIIYSAPFSVNSIKLRHLIPKSGTTKGFTLIELMVVVSIIAILSMIGLTVFTNVQKSARDAKRKADIDAISKAYEVNYKDSYQALLGGNFVSGEIPADPNPQKGDYFNWLDADGAGFKVCASLEDNSSNVCNTPGENCYCKLSSQGEIPEGSTADESSTQDEFGLGGSAPSVCDPNGSLLSGLVGYWKMDEGTGDIVSDSSGNDNDGYLNGSGWSISCKAGGCVRSSSNGSDIGVGSSSLFNTRFAMTYSVWLRLSEPFTPLTSYRRPVVMSSKGGDTHLGYGIRYLINTSNHPTDPNALYLYFEWGRPPCIFPNTNYTSLPLASTTDPATPLLDGNWHLATVTYDGEWVRTYYDGVEINSEPQTGGFCDLGSNSLLFGQKTSGSYDVIVDDARIYDKALFPDEIMALADGCTL